MDRRQRMRARGDEAEPIGRGLAALVTIVAAGVVAVVLAMVFATGFWMIR